MPTLMKQIVDDLVNEIQFSGGKLNSDLTVGGEVASNLEDFKTKLAAKLESAASDSLSGLRFGVTDEDDLANEHRYIDFQNTYELFIDDVTRFRLRQTNDAYWDFNPTYSYFAVYDINDAGSVYQDMNANPNEAFAQIGARRGGFTKNSDIFIGAHETLGNYIKLHVITPTYDYRFEITKDGFSITGLANYANDAAAAVGNIPVGGLYHTSGTLKIRLV